MFILSLFSVFVAGVAADCVHNSGFIRAVDTGKGVELGKVAITLSDSGSFGLTNSSDPTLYAKFIAWNDCVNEYPVYLTIGNTPVPDLQYASYIALWADCSQASFPGSLLFAPSNGGATASKPYAAPSQMLTTWQNDWKTPATYCGETMNWGANLSTHWVNPGGQLWSNFPILYDPPEDRIIFVSSTNDYPNAAYIVTLDWV
ncbi:hypothetical protein DL96DRAFT_1685831 [Flagelloscypha sp. PMI_526]|nr:hypothetical protein DL96DRAFT_1685831 [Flagelloscypha sp. PMI_526]